MAGDGTEDILRAWVEAELRPWTASPLDRATAERRLRDAAARDGQLCLFRLFDGEVAIDPFTVRRRPFMCDPDHGSGYRVAAYRRHLEDVARLFGVRGHALLGMYVADGYPEAARAPFFCFQKPDGAPGMLVPDIDLLSYDYCLDVDGRFDDPVPFEAKRPEAVFFGSTTGRRIATTDDVENGANERLAAAIFFRDKPGVTFRLPNVVQCTAKVRAAVEALGVTGRQWSWDEQQRYRYMLSLDGNGATCSRVAMALHGHQLLAKYASPNQLYYFRGLQPWRHYVPIVEHADVLDLVADADAALDRHRRIAEEGRAFALRFLTRLPIMRYTALLLAAYVARFGEGGSAINEAPPVVDCAVRLTAQHPRWAAPGGWGGEHGVPIEGVTLLPYGIPARDLSYQGVYADGGSTPWVRGGERCGADGRALAGLRVELTGAARRDWSLVICERFADGAMRRTSSARSLPPARVPLTGFAIQMRPAPMTRLSWHFHRLTGWRSDRDSRGP